MHPMTDRLLRLTSFISPRKTATLRTICEIAESSGFVIWPWMLAVMIVMGLWACLILYLLVLA